MLIHAHIVETTLDHLGARDSSWGFGAWAEHGGGHSLSRVKEAGHRLVKPWRPHPGNDQGEARLALCYDIGGIE